MFVIVKHIKQKGDKKRLPVILIDSQSEILEFEEKKEAENLCEILNANTDSGHTYTIKEV